MISKEPFHLPCHRVVQERHKYVQKGRTLRTTSRLLGTPAPAELPRGMQPELWGLRPPAEGSEQQSLRKVTPFSATLLYNKTSSFPLPAAGETLKCLKKNPKALMTINSCNKAGWQMPHDSSRA